MLRKFSFSIDSLPLGCLESPSKSGSDARVIKSPSRVNMIQNAIRQLATLIFLPLTLAGRMIEVALSFVSQLKAGDLCLEGKVVVVTGASSGLGERLAHAFYNEGCKLILASRRLPELTRVRDEILASESRNERVIPPVVVQLDLAETGKIQDTANAILGIYGHVDILVNNAGISYRGEISETTPDVDVKIMTVNYFGTVALTKALLPSMVARKTGHIAMIGSVQAKLAIPFRSAYAASKHALQAFSDCLRAEMNHNNIGVTVVNPGYVKTNLSLNALTGSGQQYGQMDENTESGLDPVKAAARIVTAIKRKQDELLLCEWYYHIIVFVRSLFPKLFFMAMVHRAAKQFAAKKDV